MKLYLVRHGEAISKEIDPTRPLTEKGQNDVKKVAAFLKDKCKVTCIRHSGKTRALQTAEILGAALNPPEGVIRVEGLAPNDPIEPLQRELSEMEGSLMVVGHLPYLAKLTPALLTGSVQNLITFQKGGVVCLNRQEGWQIEWMIIPNLL